MTALGRLAEAIPSMRSAVESMERMRDGEDEFHGCAYCDAPLHEGEGRWCSSACARADVYDGQHLEER